MDTVRWRRCETCVFHQQGPTPCTGICRNLDWQPKNGVQRLVRDRELACYTNWGTDHWRPRNGSGGDPSGAPSGSGPSGRGLGPGNPNPASGYADASSAEPQTIDRLIHYRHSELSRALIARESLPDSDHIDGFDDWN